MLSQAEIDTPRRARLFGIVISVLVMVVLLAIWLVHERDRQLRQVCALTGPHDTDYAQPLTDRQAIDRICNAAFGQ